MTVPPSLPNLAGKPILHKNLAQVGQKRLGLGHVDELSLAGACPVMQCRAYREGRGDTPYRIGMVHRGQRGEVHVRVAPQRRVTGYGVDGHAHAAISLVWPSVPVAGHEQRYDVRPDLADGLVVETKGIDYTVGIVGKNNVADVEELFEGFNAFRIGEVQSNALCVAVEGIEVGDPVPWSFSGFAIRIPWSSRAG